MNEEFYATNQTIKDNEVKTKDFAGIDENLFSWERLLERFGDEETAIEVVSIFLNDNTERFKQLAEAVEVRDAKQIKFLAHALRGAGGNIGSKRMWDIGSKMEHAIGQNEVELAVSCYYELKPLFEELVIFFSRSDWLELAKSMQTNII